MLQEFYDKVTSKNDKIISDKVLRHISGSDGRDLIAITEYANWNDIDAAGDIQNKLVEEGWPNEDDRKKFFKTWNKYVVTHSDEIMQESPKLRK